MHDPFCKPSAWRGLETAYRSHIAEVSPVRIIVEIGVDYGFSLFHFARDFPNATVIGIDPYNADSREHSDAEEWVKQHLPEFPNVVLVRQTSEQAARHLDLRCDLLHIDALHDFASVSQDFNLWAPAVRPGGCVLFHDVVTIADVRRFFSELPGRKSVIPHSHGLRFWFNDA